MATRLLLLWRLSRRRLVGAVGSEAAAGEAGLGSSTAQHSMAPHSTASERMAPSADLLCDGAHTLKVVWGGNREARLNHIHACILTWGMSECMSSNASKCTQQHSRAAPAHQLIS